MLSLKADEYDYCLQFSPFRLSQYLNGTIVMTVNDGDSLFFENFQIFKNRNKTMIADSDLENLIYRDPIYPIVQGLERIYREYYFGEDYLQAGWLENYES